MSILRVETLENRATGPPARRVLLTEVSVGPRPPRRSSDGDALKAALGPHLPRPERDTLLSAQSPLRRGGGSTLAADRNLAWELKMTVELETRTVLASDGRELCVEMGGNASGTPVLVHGGTPNSRHLYGPWVVDADRRSIRLISYDRPGYGGSTPSPGHSVADGA